MDSPATGETNPGSSNVMHRDRIRLSNSSNRCIKKMNDVTLFVAGSNVKLVRREFSAKLRSAERCELIAKLGEAMRIIHKGDQASLSPHRRGSVIAYSSTTAPEAIRLQLIHSGGCTTRWGSMAMICCGPNQELLTETASVCPPERVALSISRHSIPTIMSIVPTAKKNERHTVMTLNYQ